LIATLVLWNLINKKLCIVIKKNIRHDKNNWIIKLGVGRVSEANKAQKGKLGVGQVGEGVKAQNILIRFSRKLR